MAQTLLTLAGASPVPARLSEGVLLLIDMQNEYYDGPLALNGVAEATARTAALLLRARACGTPVIHIRHKGRPGGAFDIDAPRGAIHADLTPLADEVVIDKSLPNAFAGTPLAEALSAYPGKPLIVAGFMTHMCVSATVRAALDHGRFSTVLSDATATRDLPDPRGGADVPAGLLHTVTLAALADRFAVIAASAELQD